MTSPRDVILSAELDTASVTRDTQMIASLQNLFLEKGYTDLGVLRCSIEPNDLLNHQHFIFPWDKSSRGGLCVAVTEWSQEWCALHSHALGFVSVPVGHDVRELAPLTKPLSSCQPSEFERRTLHCRDDFEQERVCVVRRLGQKTEVDSRLTEPRSLQERLCWARRPEYEVLSSHFGGKLNARGKPLRERKQPARRPEVARLCG